MMTAMILRVLYMPVTPSNQVIMDALPGGARAGTWQSLDRNCHLLRGVSGTGAANA
jgi:hypothetical protein